MLKRLRMSWGIALLVGATGVAQNLPDAPSASVQPTPLQDSATARTPAASSSVPVKQRKGLSDRDKFRVFVSHAQSPLMFAGAGMNAMTMQPGGYGSRWAWPRNYTAALAERESNAFFGRYLFPVLFNQDPRYHPSESERLMPRAFYAASRVLITRKDDGKQTVNTSYLLSTLLTSSLANAYKRPWDRTAANTFGDMGATIGGDAGFNLLREFWPQLRESISNHTPKPLKKLGKKLKGDDEQELPSERALSEQRD